MKIDTKVRDQVALLAREYGGVTLNTALKKALRELRHARVLAEYARLESNKEEWEDYLAEGRLFEQAGVADVMRSDD